MSVGQYVAGVHLTVENLNHKAILNDIETNTYEREATGSPASWLDSDNQWYDQFPHKISFFQRSYEQCTRPNVFYSMDLDLVDANIQFEVRKDFQPTVTTEPSPKELQSRQKVTDQVVFCVNAANEDRATIRNIAAAAGLSKAEVERVVKDMDLSWKNVSLAVLALAKHRPIRLTTYS